MSNYCLAQILSHEHIRGSLHTQQSSQSSQKKMMSSHLHSSTKLELFSLEEINKYTFLHITKVLCVIPQPYVNDKNVSKAHLSLS